MSNIFVTTYSTGPVSPYCYDDDLNKQYGKSNVDKWADLNNNQVASEIAGRRLWARVTATAEIDDRLGGGPYSVPFTKPYPALLRRLCAEYAGVLLYESRGIQDFNPDTGQAVHKLMWQRKDFEKRIRMIHAGMIAVGSYDIEVTTYPRAVND